LVLIFLKRLQKTPMELPITGHFEPVFYIVREAGRSVRAGVRGNLLSFGLCLEVAKQG